MSPARARLLGLLLVLAAVFLVAEAVVAAAWDGPPYSWVDQAISELGRTDCGSGVIPACSPRHALLNATLVGTGVRVVAALALGWGLLCAAAGPVLAATAAVLAVLHAVGLVLVGVFPLHTRAVGDSYDGGTGHGVGALLCIGAGVLVLLALGAALLRQHPAAGSLAIGLGIVGLGALGMALTGVGPFGAVERTAVYAPILWQIVAGIGLLLIPTRALHRQGEGDLRPQPDVAGGRTA